MKRFITAVFVFLMFISLCGEGSAAILDLPDVDGEGYFQDTSTGKTWMDLDNFFGQNYNTVKDYLALNGYQYHIATLSDLQALADSVDPSKYIKWYPIIGGYRNDFSASTETYSDYDFLGMFDDSAVPDNGRGWVGRATFLYSDFEKKVYPWNIAYNQFNPDASSMSGTIGTWVVSDFQTAAVPEPMTLSLFGMGLAGFAFKRRKV